VQGETGVIVYHEKGSVKALFSTAHIHSNSVVKYFGLHVCSEDQSYVIAASSGDAAAADVM
jgi:hypothetical protein